MDGWRELVTYLGRKLIQFRNPLDRIDKEEEGSLIFGALMR